MQLRLRAVGTELIGAYTNDGDAPLGLTFWWNRTMRVLDGRGRIVAPTRGPVRPCGVAEELEILAPGTTFERAEPLACTQPAGAPEGIGWSYALEPGDYRVTLIYEAPPPHGFTQHDPDPRLFRGRVESNEALLSVPPRKSFGLF